MIKEKNKIINNFLAFIDVIIAWVSLDITYFIQNGNFYLFEDKGFVIQHFLILFIWFTLSKVLRLSELYRSRPYSVLLFNCILLALAGTAILVFFVFIIEQHYISIKTLLYFAAITLVLTFTFKLLVFYVFKNARKKGYNSRTVLIVGDRSSVQLIKLFLSHKEWGYQISAVVGDEAKEYFHEELTFLPEDVDVDKLLVETTIDELIFCYELPDMTKIQNLLLSCNEVGVVFRMYSPVFNMLSNKTHLHYFGTTPLLTISNTPLDYLSLKIKGVFDFVSALLAITILSPLYVIIALVVASTSKGQVFFKQVRVGLRGRQFWLYKFRTMVTNAEDLMDDLKMFNEMDGPTFKMTHDPRITKVGHFLRKTGLDELPQFFNILLGHMSLVGPRPPVPKEVKEYERWQLRRLSMKPGITCIWQISESRNDISFDDWMRMDMEYIDNWTLKLDFIIILKTIRSVIRADGK
jgi:exopolysaccharide biosynthesis polyprenyl glycosylphosphotransferase